MMNRKLALMPLVMVLGLFGCSIISDDTSYRFPTDGADFVFENGQIRTPSGWSTALAVKDGEIIALGAAASNLASEAASVIDLGGRTVLPGLHDMHVHPYFAGLGKVSCKFPSGAAPELIQQTVADCVSRSEPGSWIEGGSWVAAVFEPGQQTRQFLDAVSPDNPVFLWDESLHSAWVNSKALKRAGISRDTVTPEGGIIDRDPSGEPTGLLRETAVNLVENIIPPPSEAQQRDALFWATSEMARFGITSFTIASVRREEIAAWASQYDQGLIAQRARGCIVWAPEWAQVDTDGEALLGEWAHHKSGRLKFDCVKIFLDGVPTESRTAAMLEPYLSPTDDQSPDHGSHRGKLLIPQDELNAVVARFDREGLHIKFHAVGDGAARSAIEAIAFARTQNGLNGPRHDLGHNSFVHPDDFAKAKAAGVAWEFSPYIWYPTPIASIDIMRVVGEERMKRWIPIADAVTSGNLVVSGSDWSVVPSVNPFLAIETMVTREVPGGSAETLGHNQRVTREQAFAILSSNGAVLMGHDDKVGTLEVGKQADFFIASDNLFDMPIHDVHALNVEATFIAGTLVYADPDSPFGVAEE